MAALKVLTVRMDDAIHRAFRELAHERRMSCNRLAVSLLLDAILENDAARVMLIRYLGDDWKSILKREYEYDAAEEKEAPKARRANSK